MSVLKAGLETLSGVSKQTLFRLHRLELFTLRDLLFHLPLRYEDRRLQLSIDSLAIGQKAQVFGKVEKVHIATSGRRLLTCHLNDGTGILLLKFIHYSPAQAQLLKQAVWLQCFGEVREFCGTLEMVHPQFQLRNENQGIVLAESLTPIYSTTEGLGQFVFRKIIPQALTLCDDELEEHLPEHFLQTFDYPTFRHALREIHAPTQTQTCRMVQRLAHEELLAHYLSMKKARQHVKRWQAPVFSVDEKRTAQFLASLPFKLTRAQQRVSDEIMRDCQKTQPMLRLVQGDVGSGKTLVAALAALQAICNGYQVVLMVPTELLAEQHYRNFKTWFEALFGFRLLFLTGQLKGKQREEGLNLLACGDIDLAIGTHALFQAQVQFHRLGLIIIDEQHRFGVDQRLALLSKGEAGKLRAHQLVMTATPIPRTLAMMQYGDLDVSIIDELPPNRKPVTTRVMPAQRRTEVIAKIDDWVASKRQAYWVCTLIDESQTSDYQAAEDTAKMLKEQLPHVRIGLVHGRMKAAEKDDVMRSFKNHELDLLVATTVIEVGVDVPNAGVMVIENPERLGLSQLHQLRGRVGRGDDESFCVLLYASLTDIARERLSIMREHFDGFVIAEKDLQLRGTGEILGTRQKGKVAFRVADIARDAALFEGLNTWGDNLLNSLPTRVESIIERWIENISDYVEV